MPYERSSLQTVIREDLELTEGRREMVKAAPWEKLRPRKMKLSRLHVNPDDEFCFPDIGPNDAIVENYASIARRQWANEERVYDEPLQVVKLKIGEYMILNGHHRWAGALKARVPVIRVLVRDP